MVSTDTEASLSPLDSTNRTGANRPHAGSYPTRLEGSEDPLNWSPRNKWPSTVIVVLMTATIAFCSSIHTAAITSIAVYFECSRTVSTLGVTTFLIGFASGPLLFAPLSEVYGRNIIYRVTLLLFALFNIGCALSPNVAALLVFRFLCGFFGSPTGILVLPHGDLRVRR